MGEIGDGAALHFHQGDVFIVPSAVGAPVAQDVAAVRAPCELLVPVLIGIVDALVEALRGAALGGENHQFRAVAQVGQPFPVRRYLHLEGGFACRTHALFLNLGGIGEAFVLFVDEGAFIDAPAAVPLGGVVQFAAVLGEADAALLLRRVGDAPGGVEFDGRDKDIATHHQRQLFSVRRNRQGRCALEGEGVDVFLVFVAVEGDVHLAALEGVQVSVIGIGDRSVLGHGQEAHRVFVVEGELNLVFRVRDAAAEHVGRFAVFLAQEVERVSVGRENGVAVFAFVGGKLFERGIGVDGALLRRPAQPDVARNGGGMVLAERILVAFPVLVQDGPLVVDAHGRNGERGDQLRRFAVQVGLVQARFSGEAVKTGAHEVGVLPGEIDGSVGRYGQRCLIAGQGSEAGGNAAFFSTDIQVLAAFTPAGKYQLLTVCRPERIAFIGAVGRNLTRLSTGGWNGENIAFIAECQCFAIRRDGIATNPSGAFLGFGCSGERKAGDEGKNKFFHEQI